MTNGGSPVVLCVSVLLLARPTMAIGGFEMELLMSKMDYLQDKLQEVEQTMKETIEKVESKLESRINVAENFMQRTMKIELLKVEQASKKRHVNLQDKLAKFEKDVMRVNFKIETTVHAMKDFFMPSVETKEDNTEDNLPHAPQLNPSMKPVTLRSCQQVPNNESGKDIIKLGINTRPFEVLCEQTKFDGGWTVIQNRFDGSVNFYRNWTEYRNGFGTLDGEFWLGLEYVHQLTKNRPHELLVEIKDFHGNYGYAKYDEFEIGSESEKYVLKKLGTYTGTAGDSMVYNKYEMFSTFDRDNDQSGGNCAELQHGAWWFYRCTYTNLNGRYQDTTKDKSAMTWYYFKDNWRGLSHSRMMIRDIIN